MKISTVFMAGLSLALAPLTTALPKKPAHDDLGTSPRIFNFDFTGYNQARCGPNDTKPVPMEYKYELKAWNCFSGPQLPTFFSYRYQVVGSPKSGHNCEIRVYTELECTGDSRSLGFVADEHYDQCIESPFGGRSVRVLCNEEGADECTCSSDQYEAQQKQGEQDKGDSHGYIGKVKKPDRLRMV